MERPRRKGTRCTEEEREGKKRSDEQEQAETVQLIYDLKGPNQP
jgi:hypothetical protein